MQQPSMGFSGMPNMGANTFRTNNSFGASSMGMGGRSMPGLSGGMPGAGSGLNLGGAGASLQGGLNTNRLGSFGAMQGAQSSYSPSGEILAMINKGQGLGLGLPPNQPLGMSSALPQSLSQPGMQPGQQGLGLGMPTADLGGGMGGVPLWQ